MKANWLVWIIVFCFTAFGCSKKPTPSTVVSGAVTNVDVGIATTPAKKFNPFDEFDSITNRASPNPTKLNTDESVFEDTESLATKTGNPLAEYALGVFYANGQGVTQNYFEAAKWFRKSADQDFVDAQYSLWPCPGYVGYW